MSQTTIHATYRLQLRPSFGFAAAATIAPYLEALGVSHVYASPYLQAAPGSEHGYDVVDPSRVSADLGGDEAHAAYRSALGAHGIGEVLDIVPNHMAISGGENPWWWDVLENGPASRFAAYFDVDWDPPEARLRNLVLLPVLGDHYGRVLEAGELRLERRGDAEFRVLYHDRPFPLSPRSLDGLLRAAADAAGSTELRAIADALSALPEATARDADSVQRRFREWSDLRARLAALLRDGADVAGAVDAVLAAIGADADALDALLDRQNYRLAFWKAADRDLGYRRFFDVDSLVGLRVEDPLVFAATHALALRWLAEGRVDGLRVDHVDGLRDPAAYCRRLAALAPDAWIVVEKILEPEEHLRATWPVHGTTGYDFLNRVGRLLVDPAGEAGLDAAYAGFIGESRDWSAMVRESKHRVLRELLGSDVNRLVALFLQVCERHRRQRDHTRHGLHEALKEWIVCLPVYRTYADPREGRVDPEDEALVERATAQAKANRPDVDAELLDFLRDVLLLRRRGELEDELALRVQQLTGAVMAKGVEDTAFYGFNRFVALNEVGGDPSRFAVSPEEFHAACAETLAHHPRTMLSLSTHDTKRSADVRARLFLLSEMPERWREAIERWSAHNERHRRDGAPDRNAEILLYQTLVGAWPIEADRVQRYMQKAVREAKERTSWLRPDEAYEAALGEFVDGILGDADFVRDLERFVAPLVPLGRLNALAQTLLCLTTPGVPDLYQGSELWDLSLADPDNRRPVDFALRRRLAEELQGSSPEEIVARSDDGLPKLWLVQRALAVRARHPEAFGANGAYAPLSARGERAEHVVAFMRGGAVLAVVPRLVQGLAGRWGDTRLTIPSGTWRNTLDGEPVAGGDVEVARLLARFPVALLEREDGGCPA